MNAVLTMNRDNVGLSESDQLLWPATPPSGALFVDETATELLRTIAGVLDIRAVFPRVRLDNQQERMPLHFIQRHDAHARNQVAGRPS